MRRPRGWRARSLGVEPEEVLASMASTDLETVVDFARGLLMRVN